MCFIVRLLYNENFPPWIRSGFVAFHRNTHLPAPRYTNVYGHHFNIKFERIDALGMPSKKKIAEKETLVNSHLPPSPPSLNGTRGMGT